MKIRHLFFVVVLLLMRMPINSNAQQILSGDRGEKLGWHFSLLRGAPRVIVLPGAMDDDADRIALAKKMLRLRCNVYVPIMPQLFTSPLATPDTLVAMTREAISQIFSWDSPQTVILIGSQRSASVALLTSMEDFRVKSVIAISPGEYFTMSHYVEHSLNRISVPVLALYSLEEQGVARKLFSKAPRRHMIFSPTLSEMGYASLLSDEKKAGAPWLAVSIFYSEQFDHSSL